MIIGGVIAICVLLLILAFVAPRLSRHPQRGVDKGLGMGSRTGSKAPGKLGDLVERPAVLPGSVPMPSVKDRAVLPRS